MACALSVTSARGRGILHRALTRCASAKHLDSRYTNTQHSPDGFDPTSAAVYPHFLTKEEGKSLIREASKRLKRRRFESGHWDSVITGYREVELSTPAEERSRLSGQGNMDADENDVPFFAKVIERTRGHIATHHLSTAALKNVQWLPCHVIDLSANGELSAHVDSVKFSGDVVAGVSLLSDSIMRLRPSSREWESESDAQNVDGKEQPNGYVDLYLPQMSLYVLSGMSRYSYTHELLPSGSSFSFSDRTDLRGQHENDSEGNTIEVLRGRRLSIIFRDAHCGSNS